MILLQDKFVDANGTALASHVANLGGPWTSPTPGFLIESNKLTGTGASGESQAVVRGRTIRASFDLDLNAAADATTIQMYLMKDLAFTDVSQLEIQGSGEINTDNYGAGGDDFSADLQGLQKTGVHSFIYHITYSRIELWRDGQLLFTCPRPSLGSLNYGVVDLQFGVAAGTFPILSNLLVTT